MAGVGDSEIGRDGCAKCAAPLAPGQRYCLACGMRKGSLPDPVAAHLAALLRRDRGGGEGEETAEAGPSAADWMPTPRTAATLVMLMLALGVVLGSVTDHIAQSAGLPSIFLEVPPEAPPLAAAGEPGEPAPEEAAIPASEAAAASLPVGEAGAGAPLEEAPPEEFFPEETGLPEVKHVFVVMLGENSFEEAFGEGSAAPYLAQDLPRKGGLLANYYAVAQGDLANQIALLSGQGPTVETAQNCPHYGDIVPGTVSPEGQVEGSGCVYPAGTESLPTQLALTGMEWKAYVEDIGNAPGQPASCRHPSPGSDDPWRAPVAGDAYLTWRNPFVYFRSIVDGPECAERNVGLDRLAPDLESGEAPTLSYIVPNACHDGGPVPCEPGLPAGPAETEPFLRTVIPKILDSPAYEEGGLIAITSAQARQDGETPDSSACCAYPAYPNVPQPPQESIAGPTKASGGGGRVGLLLLSPFVQPGTVSEGYFNHYTLLLTIEELLGLPKLGYANEAALTAFGESVFNAE